VFGIFGRSEQRPDNKISQKRYTGGSGTALESYKKTLTFITR
jgi:hypothetical protein